ncbi:MAG: 4-hydroxy-tetrahydrodipicolinate synthase [Gemmatimonadaceae bacterium]|nr:4-hydroxy-tetrahydrodipicolinate synthase [Gemmatimonadaceae bacterium]
MTAMLKGAITAIVTPFKADGSVDEAALGAFVDWQIAEGIHGIVPVGSTGEAVTLSPAERERVVRVTAERANGRVPVIAGAGSNDTAAAIEASILLGKAGATHLLHVSPMYNKPPQRGIVAHFTAIADASPLPVVLYNVPGRTGSNMTAETTLELAEHPNIVAMKEASGNTGQIDAILRGRPEGFSVLSGDDGLTLAVMAAGGDGVISVISNAVPGLIAQLTDALAKSDLKTAGLIHHRLSPLVDAAFIESNPIPIKAAMSMMGKMQNVLRLPLVAMDSKHEARMSAALRIAGVSL